MGTEIASSSNASDWLAIMDKVRARLRTTIGSYTSIPISNRVYKHISTVASSQELLDFQLVVMKCYVGGYIFIDPDERDVFPLFGASPRTKGEPAYPLKYVWSNPKAKDGKYENAIDSMFMCWRLAESIRPEDKKNSYLPEYLCHLPLVIQSDSEHGLIHVNDDSLNPVEQDFRDKSGCHYCSMGETTFFVYAWRFLLRLIWLHGPSATFPQDDISLLEDKGPCTGIRSDYLWDPCVWSKRGSRERQWVDYIRKRELNKDAGWLELTNVLQENGPIASPWLHDWEAMLLVNRSDNNKVKPGNLLAPLLRFAEFAAAKVGSNAVSKELKAWHKLIVSPLKTETQLTVDQLCTIDGLFKRAVCDYFSGDSNALNTVRQKAAVLLEHLHRMVRFPVLPYFYWIAADGSPKTHLVIPVWTSNIETVHFSLPKDPRLAKRDKESSSSVTTVNTPVMGVAVLGVHPLDEIDWTMSDDTPARTDSQRFALLRQYYEMFAAYIADEWFYSRTRQGIRRITEELLKDAVHRINGPMGDLESAIELARDYLESRQLLDHTISNHFKNAENAIRLVEYYMDILDDKIPIDKPENINIVELTERIAEEFRLSHQVNVYFENRTVAVPHIIGYGNILRSVLDELLHNASKSIRVRDSGWIRVTVDNANTEIPRDLYFQGLAHTNEQAVMIIVEDNGPGVAPENRDKIFNRGFSTTGSTGYGLWRVKNALRDELGGEIFECGATGHGAKFCIQLLAKF